LWQDLRLIDVSSTVINRPGGNMSVAAALLAQRPGDAHILQVVSPTLLTTHILKGSGYNYTDFTPLAILGRQYLALAVPVDSPIKSGGDLAAKLKTDPASVTFGLNGGIGNNLHILISVVGKAAGADVKKLKVAVFSGGELMTNALGSHIDIISTVTSNVVPLVESGKLRILGIAAPQRLGGTLAQVPTWREQGIDAVVVNWAGVLGAKGLTREQTAFWDGVFTKTTSADQWQKEMARQHWDAELLTATATAAYLKNDYAKLSGALGDLGLAKKQ
ncbi:MAG: tripartite tricarboxylate transporter substrate binding protein, partial [Burkholderiales bacterium]